MPVLPSGGVPLLPSPAKQNNLKLSSKKIYRSEIVSLIHEVQN
jgi:hypothetical protein